jgi:cyclohexanone monooxygenase
VSENEVGSGAAVDAEAVRQRYEAERAKRLNAAGTAQFIFAEGQYAEFAQDPFAVAVAPRESVTEDIDFLIIGAGIGGIQLAATLQKQGIENFRILDVAADFGGTWYWNRYPGLRCDVESYIYLPMLEETGYIPTELYVRGSEIFSYLKGLAHQLGLPDRSLFQTRVQDAIWDEDAGRWIIRTDRGDTLRARFVSTQSGLFNKPQLPGIAGIKDFKGKAFHSARWDYAYTGGNPDTPLNKLGDKRVAVIGTGTTALQVVPQLAQSAKELFVFQRTPTSVGERNNAPTDAEWFKSQPPGWQDQRIKSFNQLSMGEPVDCPIKDGWTRFFQLMIDAVAQVPADQFTPENIGKAQEVADYELNELIRARVDSLVRDKSKASLLKAYYRTMCKRPGFSDDYLPAFDQDNVQLFDASSGIDRITENSIVIGGREIEVDCIVFCTGFEIGTAWTHQAGYDVVGRDGVRLSEKWAEGPLTYHGLFSKGFPNLFFMGVTQTAATINLPHMLQEQATHIAYVVQHCLANGISWVEASDEAEQAWQVEINENVASRRSFQEACTPGYYNGEGKIYDRRNAIGNGWYMPTTAFFNMWDEWRKSGTFTGLVLAGHSGKA